MFCSKSVQLAIGPSKVNVIETRSVGDSVGSNVGVLLTYVGTTVDSTEGPNVGTSVESYDGSNVGTSEEAYEGHIVGTNVGSWLGYSVPVQYLPVGNRVGVELGLFDGYNVGICVGFRVGESEGCRDVYSVSFDGARVGSPDGA